ncbi:MAG: zincin-like metallopeptidase domain-containing protein, partial [Kiritimatiellae bacterium]|nr:zincin-like metallopeptidase domain-containing protein [Kiritimatiellia bacterium]
MNEITKPFVDAVAGRLIEQLRAGTAPWQKPWEAGEPGGHLPMNPTTGNRYNGINAVNLMCQGREDHRWMTYKQAAAAGANVRKGEKGTPIQYWKFSDEQPMVDSDGKPVLDARGKQVKQSVKLERPALFTATVFNAEQIDGLPPPQPAKKHEWNGVERAEQILAASGADIRHGESDRAFYRAATDRIHMPDRSQFPTADAYYAVALHELGHWSGHESRLGRDLSHPFGSEGYAREELRAEIASMILGDELGIGHDPAHHAAYVGSWIKVLQDDPLEIFRAAADAERIQGFVLGLAQTQELAQSNEQSQTQAVDQTSTQSEAQARAEHIEDPADSTRLRTVPVAVVEQASVRSGLASRPGDVNAVVMATNEHTSAPSAESEARSLALATSAVLALADNPEEAVALAYEAGRYGSAPPPILTDLALRESFQRGGADVGSDHLDQERAEAQNVDAFEPAPMDGTDSADEVDARLVADFIAANHNLLPAKIAENTLEAKESLRSIMADAARMDALDTRIGEILQGIRRAYVDSAQAVIAETLGRIDAESLSAAAEMSMVEVDSVDHIDGVTIQMVADFIAANQACLPEKVTSNILEASPSLRAVMGSGSAMDAIGDRLEEILDGINPDYVRQVRDVALDAIALSRLMEENVTMKNQTEIGRVRVPAKDVPAQAHEGMAVDVSLDAPSELSETEKAVALARIHEEQVRRDPGSTNEDVTAAREARKDAELAAVQGDADFQRRVAEFEKGRSESTQAGSSPSPDVVEDAPQKAYILVPYREKEEARALGAKWDRREQSWYIPAGADPVPFDKWARDVRQAAAEGQGERQESAPSHDAKGDHQQRVFLAVPYHERLAAKAAGALWDKAAKSWFVGEGGDRSALERWNPDRVRTQQAPAMKPREEFAEALAALGCFVSGEHPLMDGKTHRITVEGEKFSEHSGSGFYVGHLDGHPAGYIKNNKTGSEMTWKSKGYALNAEQEAQLRRDASARRKAREVEQAAVYERAAKRVGKQMASLVPVEQPTPYMRAKGIEPQPGVFTDKAGQRTYIPATDATGKQWTMQYIQEDRTKRFAKDSRKHGCFHVVGGLDALESVPALVVSEGYATASTLSKSLGFPVVAAFDSGNLPQVARALHEKYPDKPVVIAGDNDRHLEATQGVNPGRAKAEQAAKLVGGIVLLPIFAPGESSFPAGLAPVTPEKHREHQRTG